MRRTLILTPLFIVLLASVAYAAAKLATTRVFVNGVPLREQAIVQEGVTYVPVRAVAEALHCEVVWDKKTGVQIWGSLSPTPSEAPVPGAGFNPYPRPAQPEPASPKAPTVP